MDRLLTIALIIGVFAVAAVLFENSENGRYQYSPGIIVDTRTGEYWTQDGSHFEPREARITVHQPSVNDQTASDDRHNKFLDCLHTAIDQKKPAKDCVTADLKQDGSQPATPAQTSTSPTSH
jgi:hypothetical protein